MPLLLLVNLNCFFYFATYKRTQRLLAFLFATITVTTVAEELPATLQIASAANFRPTLELLARNFTKQHPDIILNISSGSTGALYEQIIHGAPYDLYFAADQQRPRLLVEKEFAVKSSLFDYAQGQLVLLVKHEFAKARQFSCTHTQALTADKATAKFLGQANKIIIANPRIAPYGEAAANFLFSVENTLQNKARWQLVTAKNVLHAQQLFQLTQAPVAIVSTAQLQTQQHPLNAISCVISMSTHKPIIQSAVIINRVDGPLKTPGRQAAIQLFWHYMHSKSVTELLTKFGYRNTGKPPTHPL